MTAGHTPLCLCAAVGVRTGLFTPGLSCTRGHRRVHTCTQDTCPPPCDTHAGTCMGTHAHTCTDTQTHGYTHTHGHTCTRSYAQPHAHIQAFSTSMTHLYRKYTRAQKCVPSATSKKVCACTCVCGVCEEPTGLLLRVSPEVGPMVLPVNAPSPAQGPSDWAAAGCLPQKPGPQLGEGLDGQGTILGVSPAPG